MTEKTLVVLMGEQPVPLLLSIREQKPDRVIIIYTDRTEKRARKLQKVIAKEAKDIIMASSNAYDLPQVMEAIQNTLPDSGEIIFDVTGGTKMMSLATALVARQHRAQITYIKTAKSQGKILQYHLTGSRFPRSYPPRPLKASFTLEEYLNLYLDHFDTSIPIDRFEQAVYNALKGKFDEILCSVKPEGSLEIDMVIRCGIQVGIIEVKRRGRKKGIDQLNTAGGRDYLGTWVQKFYIVNEEWDQNNKGMQSLRELAEARRITLIELPSFTESPPAISKEDADKLIKAIRDALACK